ncbi:MAG: response regulator [Flavobacteriales bacterium]|nr:response regulator [Flavobacteriales bacterium]PCH85362.1 MAG: hypothetical protein COB88_10085 [Flavobacteriales bacterium]
MGEDIKILIVEDEILIAEDLRMILENEGYSVVGIPNNGNDALKLATQRFPEIIFMDINLKGEWNGIQTAEAIREAYPAIIIYLTSCQDPPTLTQAEQSKPYKILTKFRKEEILETLTSLCSTF